MTKFLFAVSALALSVPAPSIAQPGSLEPSATFQTCMNNGEAALGNVTAIQTCIGTELVSQEDRRDDAYHQAMTRGNVADKIRLRAGERDFRSNLSALCAAHVGTDRSGNIKITAYERCRLDETIARAAWLETYSPE